MMTDEQRKQAHVYRGKRVISLSYDLEREAFALIGTDVGGYAAVLLSLANQCGEIGKIVRDAGEEM